MKIDDPLDREPNYGAEQAMLSAMMQNSAVIQDARDLLDRSDYRLESSRIIARAIFSLTDQGIVADEVSVISHLKEAGTLAQAGGTAYVSSLTREGVPQTDNVRGYARIAKRLAINHHIELEREAMRLEIADGESPVEVLEKHMPRLMELQRQAVGGGETDTLVDSLGCTGAELATREAVAVDWIALGYVAAGALTEIIGRVKEGKTTFELALIRACLFGGDFIGHYVDPCRVVIVTEQGEVTFSAQAGEAGILGHENFTVIFKHELMRFPWEQRVKLVMAKADKIGAAVVFWDTFGALAGLKDDGENGDEAGRKMRDLSEAAAVSRRAIVALRHARKSGGDASDAGRGYSGISGAVDIVVLLKKTGTNQGDNIRELEAISRFSETPPSAVIELVGQHYRLLGDAVNIRQDRNRAAILEALPREPAEPVTLDHVMNDAGLRRETTRTILAQLVKAGDVQRCGRGCSGSPLAWRIPASKVYQNDVERSGLLDQQTGRSSANVYQDGNRQKQNAQGTSSAIVSEPDGFVPEAADQVGRNSGRTGLLSTAHREGPVGRQTSETNQTSVYQQVNTLGLGERQTGRTGSECLRLVPTEQAEQKPDGFPAAFEREDYYSMDSVEEGGW